MALGTVTLGLAAEKSNCKSYDTADKNDGDPPCFTSHNSSCCRTGSSWQSIIVGLIPGGKDWVSIWLRQRMLVNAERIYYLMDGDNRWQKFFQGFPPLSLGAKFINGLENVSSEKWTSLRSSRLAAMAWEVRSSDLRSQWEITALEVQNSLSSRNSMFPSIIVCDGKLIELCR